MLDLELLDIVHGATILRLEAVLNRLIVNSKALPGRTITNLDKVYIQCERAEQIDYHDMVMTK